jgi:hypothetical protein
MPLCAQCGDGFDVPPDVRSTVRVPGAARVTLCPPCRTGWLAARDQFYAEAREANRRSCRDRGHNMQFAGPRAWNTPYCARCGYGLPGYQE